MTNPAHKSNPRQWRLLPDERRVILMTGDFIVSLIAVIIAILLWSGPDWLGLSLEFLRDRIPWWFYLLPLLWMFLLMELYDVQHASNIRHTLTGILFSAAGFLGVYLLIYFSSKPDSMPRLGVAIFIGVTVLLTILWRLIYIRIFTAPQFLRRVLIIGAGRAGTNLAEKITKLKPMPFTLIGFIDDDPAKQGHMIAGFPVIGTSKELLRLADEHQVTDLVMAIMNEVGSETFDTLIAAEEQGLSITSMPLMYEQLLGRVPIFLLKSDWILRTFYDRSHAGGFYDLVKRLFDLIGGLAVGLLMIPVFPIVALVILLESGWPIIYSQKRLGKSSKEYTIYKFRTMRQDAEKDGKAKMAVQNDDRVTRVGRFLRKSHIDEFPQFINVLSGEMSLVGPRAERPELVKELEQVVPFYRARLLVKPGVTGWAQVNYGYASNAEETAIKLEYDLYYIQYRNLLLDIVIIIKTITSVIGFKGQ